MDLTSRTERVKEYLKNTAKKFKGAARRLFQAETVQVLGPGGQTWVERELGWCRSTVRKGLHELETGITCIDAFNARGRKPAESRLPKLQDDIRQIMESQVQTDPTFRTTRLYRRLSAAEVRRQLIEQKEYKDEELLGEESIRLRLDRMGYRPRKVQKCKPKKKIPETDAIFQQLDIEHRAIDEDPTALRISLDTKNVVKVGDFSRGGYSRVEVRTLDHDFGPDAQVTPVGLLVVKTRELFLYMVVSKGTADCLADVVEHWWASYKARCPGVGTLAIDQDNGPENQSRRTQYMHRLVGFADKCQLNLALLYYPPYHSKYNPVERCFGALENYWRGSVLDTVKAVVEMAKGMKWHQQHPTVELVTRVYEKGVKLTREAMDAVEARLDRLPRLGKWFVGICSRAGDG